MSRILFATAAAAISILSNTAFAEEGTSIDFDDVPAEIMAKANETAPGLEFTSVSIEIENGIRIYEFEATDHDGNHYEVDITEQGDLDEVETEISKSDLPETVTQKLDEAYPDMAISFVEQSIRSNGIFVYEIEAVLVDGRSVDIEIDEDGDIRNVAFETLG